MDRTFEVNSAAVGGVGGSGLNVEQTVVAQDNAVRIKHWYDLKLAVASSRETNKGIRDYKHFLPLQHACSNVAHHNTSPQGACLGGISRDRFEQAMHHPRCI